MSEARLIKRYPNRKLYDTGDSRYITLDEIANLVADGVDIRIVDNQTKDDLTDVTLAQILVEQGRKGKLEHSVSIKIWFQGSILYTLTLNDPERVNKKSC